MRVFLVRHGDARGSLTENGRMQISATANFLESLKLDPLKTVLLTSERQMAVETAEIIRERFGFNNCLQKSWLTCGTDEHTKFCLENFIRDNPQFETVICVSHEPELEEVLRALGFYKTVPKGSVHEIQLSTGTASRLY
ncbi:MAG: histidine phosphatase family protein [Parcubacteria group bacterium]|nr:histidine phosphatase family protein [Parcubacteria group bacterium]